VLKFDIHPPIPERRRQAGQNWVPAFAGMSGFKRVTPCR
jgi:hypothetical protein